MVDYRKQSMIVRFPEEDIGKINELIKTNENITVKINISEGYRIGEIFLCNSATGYIYDEFSYTAEVLDLPRHVEEYEISSKEQAMSFVNKMGDVSQIIIAHRGAYAISNGPDTVVCNAEKNCPEAYTYRHGITPPTRNVVKKSKTIEEIEKERKTIGEMEKAIQYSITGDTI